MAIIFIVLRSLSRSTSAAADPKKIYRFVYYIICIIIRVKNSYTGIYNVEENKHAEKILS